MDTLKSNGLVLAALAATLFAAAPLAADQAAGSTTGKCFGVNSCKGKSSCKSAGHTCKSQNACKGQGFVIISKDACDQIGGRFEPKT